MTYHDNDPGHTNAHNDHATQIAAVQTAVSGKAEAVHGHGYADVSNLVPDLAVINSRLAALEVLLNRGVLVLGLGDPVPDGTPVGTVILRTS